MHITSTPSPAVKPGQTLQRRALSKFIVVILVVMSLFPDRASAQRKEDVIYLSEGSVIHGLIIDSTGTKVKIVNHIGNILAFDREEIDSIKHEKYFEYKAGIFTQPGFEFNVNGEFLMRSRPNAVGKAVIPGITMQVAYRIRPLITAGIETGLEFYEWMEIPFSACITVRTTRRAVSPLFFAKTGITKPAEKRGDDFNYSYKSFGGNHFTVGIGIERVLSENSSFIFTFSYHYQELKYHLTPLPNWLQERDRTESYSRFRLTVGYVFK